MLDSRQVLINKYRNIAGIYLLYNNINNKYYIGSSVNLSQRLGTYYYFSRLKDNRYISKSINKYGHNNFSVVILEILNTNLNNNLLKKEQYYIELYKPLLNILLIAGKSSGFKHTENTKRKISILNKGKEVSIETRKYLSELFKGESNPFKGKRHTNEFINKLKIYRIGENNPMFGKEKSKEFIYHMTKNRNGENNPMFGKKKSPETIAKLNKRVYIYDSSTRDLLTIYPSFTEARISLKIGKDTLLKYIKSKTLIKIKFLVICR